MIQGFKTYKNTTVIDSFSPHHNVVVGRNGSGKSNFFAAIRFVLSDAYTHMTREERQSLIHEGSGTVMSAYVEIVFDNEDRRFPIDKDEVIIRRTIGLKKDDYSLDHKSSTRSDIMNLLESAGFSKSNPYYIVPQGRITALTNAKDSERLQLLKEVAGAQIFEVRLKESLKEMSNSNKRREKIDEMLTFIESRLDDLNLETSDLKNFEKLNNLKKMLEFNIFDKELTKLNEAIEEIDANYNNSMENANQYVQDLSARETTVKTLNHEIVKLSTDRKILEIESSQTNTDIDEILSKIATVKNKLAELNQSSLQLGATSLERETLAELERLITEREAELMSLNPLIEDLRAQESDTGKNLAHLESRQRILLSKQGRFSQFSSKTQRDSWLKDEIKKLSHTIKSEEESLLSLENLERELQQQLSALVAQIDANDNQLAERRSKNNQISNELEDLKLKYTSLVDERKSLWREDSKLKSMQANFDSELNTSRQKINETMDRSMANGLESVKRIVKNLKLDGVHGSLGELIEVSEKYKTAVEVIGGNSLFHVVVDNDLTATIIMDELIKEKSGRVTFMPLNRLKTQQVSYPDTNDCVPLLKKIGFNQTLEPAVRQVFGKAVVVLNLQRGAEIARDFKLTAITLDGDRCDKKGVMTGGFRDFNKSRLDSLAEYKKWKKEHDEIEAKLTEILSNIDLKDREITILNETLISKRKEFDDSINDREVYRNSIQTLAIAKSSLVEEISNTTKSIQSINITISSSNDQLNEFNLELSKPFVQSLSEDELSELELLKSQIPELESNLDQISNTLLENELKVSTVLSELEDNYRPRREQLFKKLQHSLESSADNVLINQVETELLSCNEELNELRAKYDQLQEQTESTQSELKKKQDQLEKINDQQRQILKKLESFSKGSEKNLNKKSILSLRRDQINKKIRELGVLPEEAFSNYVNDTSEALLVELNKTNEGLKKYNHVNKKALEQSITFTKQRDELVQRRAELDEGKASIEDLINVLEERKDKAIITTFKQVSEGFTEVFEKLVPMGTGKLIIQKKNSANANDEDEDDDDDDAMDVDDAESEDMEDLSPNSNDLSLDNYLGISIQVSFNSKDDEQQRIEQLSGGQKTLCAIALILAIQKCDPAPFYLFDEIDAALDTQYRASVANLINELSRDGKQFICTTFRTEMLSVADKFFGVLFSNKVSVINEIEKLDALGFIEGQH